MSLLTATNHLTAEDRNRVAADVWGGSSANRAGGADQEDDDGSGFAARMTWSRPQPADIISATTATRGNRLLDVFDRRDSGALDELGRRPQ